VGIDLVVKPGAKIAKSEPLAFLDVRTEGAGRDVSPRVAAAFAIGDAPPPTAVLVTGRVTA
jgi:hypothetical protein